MNNYQLFGSLETSQGYFESPLPVRLSLWLWRRLVEQGFHGPRLGHQDQRQ